MSVLLFEDKSTVGGHVTALDINGQGSSASVKPSEALRIKGKYVAQNSKLHPTDTVQIILFLDGQFFKCVYNDIPPAEPDSEEGVFSLRCQAPEKPGRYFLRAGWGFNWPWPQDAYSYLLTTPAYLTTVGDFAVVLAAAQVSPMLSPLVVFAGLMLPGVIFIGLGAKEK